MTSATDFDIGSLVWVKGEIDQALDQALKGLSEQATAAPDARQLRASLTHLHQVTGAINMVGLDAVGKFSEEIELAVQAIEKGGAAIGRDGFVAAADAVKALKAYLDDLLNNRFDSVLVLFPYFQRLRAIRNEVARESELFYPDINVGVPPFADAQSINANDLAGHLKQQRSRYQLGLLQWLRDGNTAGLQAMYHVLRAVTRVQTSSMGRGFWWAATALIEAIAYKGVPQDTEVRQVLQRMDLQLRRATEGSAKVAERLFRDILYFIARSRVETPTIKAVRQSFKLPQYLPSVMLDLNRAAASSRAAKTRTLLTNLKDAWGKYTAGNTDKQSVCLETLAQLREEAQALAQSDIEIVLTGVASIIEHGPLQRLGESAALEVATALLLLENAVNLYPEWPAEFAEQARIMTERLRAAKAGDLDTLHAIGEVPMVDEATRKAQERQLQSQVAKEIRANLQHIEQTLDSYFRQQIGAADLASLENSLRQVDGALTILDKPQAHVVLAHCAEMVHRFMHDEGLISLEEHQDVAEGLSALGFFIDEYELGRDASARVLDPILARLQGEQKPVFTIEEPQSVEHEIKAQKQQARQLLDTLIEKPQDQETKEQLTETLTSLQRNADLVADSELVEQSRIALEALEAGHTDPMAEAVAPVVAPAIEADHATALLSDEAVDAELLEIYLEEAQEVLANVGEQLSVARDNLADREAMTVIRRSFHTLKGSGRMVGLNHLGDVAWAVEQTMNRWLQDDKKATPALLYVLDQAVQEFSGWVEQLQATGHCRLDPIRIPGLCELLRDADMYSEAELLAAKARMDASATVAEEVHQHPAAPVEVAAEPVALAEPVVVQAEPVAEAVENSTEVLEAEALEELAAEEFVDTVETVAVVEVTEPVDRLELAEAAEPERVVEPVIELQLDDSETATPEAETLAVVDAEADSDLVLDLAIDLEPVAEVETPAAEAEIADLGELSPLEPTVDQVAETIFAEPDAPELLQVDAPLADFEPTIAETAAEVAFAEQAFAPEAETVSGEPVEEISADEIPVLETSVLDTVELETPAVADEDIFSLELGPETSAPAEHAEQSIDLLQEPEAGEAALPEADLADELPEATHGEDGSVLVADDGDIHIGPIAISPVLFSIFVEEAGKHVESLQFGVSKLQGDNIRLVDSHLVYAAHTIRGIANTTGFRQMGDLGAVLETWIAAHAHHNVVPTADAIRQFETGVRALAQMLTMISAYQWPTPADPGLLQALGSDHVADMPSSAAGRGSERREAPDAEALALSTMRFDTAELDSVVSVHADDYELGDELYGEPIFILNLDDELPAEEGGPLPDLPLAAQAAAGVDTNFDELLVIEVPVASDTADAVDDLPLDLHVDHSNEQDGDLDMPELAGKPEAHWADAQVTLPEEAGREQDDHIAFDRMFEEHEAAELGAAAEPEPILPSEAAVAEQTVAGASAETWIAEVETAPDVAASPDAGDTDLQPSAILPAGSADLQLDFDTEVEAGDSLLPLAETATSEPDLDLGASAETDLELSVDGEAELAATVPETDEFAISLDLDDEAQSEDQDASFEIAVDASNLSEPLPEQVRDLILADDNVAAVADTTEMAVSFDLDEEITAESSADVAFAEEVLAEPVAEASLVEELLPVEDSSTVAEVAEIPASFDLDDEITAEPSTEAAFAEDVLAEPIAETSLVDELLPVDDSSAVAEVAETPASFDLDDEITAEPSADATFAEDVLAEPVAETSLVDELLPVDDSSAVAEVAEISVSFDLDDEITAEPSADATFAEGMLAEPVAEASFVDELPLAEDNSPEVEFPELPVSFDLDDEIAASTDTHEAPVEPVHTSDDFTREPEAELIVETGAELDAFNLDAEVPLAAPSFEEPLAAPSFEEPLAAPSFEEPLPTLSTEVPVAEVETSLLTEEAPVEPHALPIEPQAPSFDLDNELPAIVLEETVAEAEPMLEVEAEVADELTLEFDSEEATLAPPTLEEDEEEVELLLELAEAAELEADPLPVEAAPSAEAEPSIATETVEFALVAELPIDVEPVFEAPVVAEVPPESEEPTMAVEPAAPPVASTGLPPLPEGLLSPSMLLDTMLGGERREEVATPQSLLEQVLAIKDDLDEQLLPIFIEEGQELLPQVNAGVRHWREEPQQAQEAVTQLKRLLHTLKGSARMAGAMRLGEATHHIESRLIQAADQGGLSGALLDSIEADIDVLDTLFEVLSSGETLELPAAPNAEELPAVVEEADIVDLAAAGGRVAPVPIMQDQEAGKALLRVRADIIDRLVNDAGEVAITRSRVEAEMLGLKRSLHDLTENVSRLRAQLREIEIQAESQMQSRLSIIQDEAHQFDPLEFDRFTRLQELTRFMAESVNDVATIQFNLLNNLGETEGALQQQGRMTKELQQQLMRIRMVPFSNVSERLYRIVRQTAKELGKKVNLEIRGGRVEIDRSVLEKMTSPFEHMLRNSIDHGLEDRDIRLAANKPEVGEVRIEVKQEGNELVLTLQDDGKGINLARVREKAVENGLIRVEDELNEEQLIQLIFAPGFSTAQEVTQISGRGIGMDVVRNEIGNLGGRIEVSTVHGAGTTFTIHLPLTLAVIHVVLIRIADRQYAIPSIMVEQVQEVKMDALNRVYEKRVVEWMGNLYPFYYMPRLLGDTHSHPETKRYNTILLIKSGALRMAVHIDELIKNLEVVVKNIGPQLARVPGITGATVLGNGDIVMILNPLQLVPVIEQLARQQAALPQPVQVEAPVVVEEATSVNTAPVVMVVDDSLTVRKITGRLLAREGYQVMTAKDGVDALQQLQEIRPDVMLVDIEMPRMDGFELTRNVRGADDTREIPIIMISSRTADKHKNYAYQLGVNVFLGKPYQEDELLTHIQNFAAERRGSH